MLLNSVIILIREVLEAVLLISILLSMSVTTRMRRSWLYWSVPAGIGAAVLYAMQFRYVADAFDGVGQEVFTAVTEALIALSLPLCMLAFIHRYFRAGKPVWHIHLLIGLMLVLAILREGSEIYLYMSAYLSVSEWRQSLYAGSAIGVGLGFSVGALFYFWLGSFDARRGILIICALASLVAAGMALQACKMLIQADWLPDGQVWDSSQWLPEDGVAGQLLYALAGYEATPAPVQVGVYLAVLVGSVLLLYGAYYYLSKPVAAEESHA